MCFLYVSHIKLSTKSFSPKHESLTERLALELQNILCHPFGNDPQVQILLGYIFFSYIKNWDRMTMNDIWSARIL